MDFRRLDAYINPKNPNILYRARMNLNPKGNTIFHLNIFC